MVLDEVSSLEQKSYVKGKKERGEGTNSGKLAVTENFPYSFHNSRWVLNVFQCKSDNTNCFLILRLKPKAF